MNPLIDVSAAAELLGVSERQIRSLIYKRQIPFVKVGGLVRFKPRDLEAWVEARTVDATP